MRKFIRVAVWLALAAFFYYDAFLAVMMVDRIVLPWGGFTAADWLTLAGCVTSQALLMWAEIALRPNEPVLALRLNG